MPKGYPISGVNTGRFQKGHRKQRAKGFHLSEDHKKKISESHLGEKNPIYGLFGENNPKWIEDRTLSDRKGRKSSANVYWIRAVKRRDKECRIGNQDCKGGLEAHHILSWRNHPELRYDLNNGIALCHFHHPRKEKDEIRLSPYFQELVKNTNV